MAVLLDADRLLVFIIRGRTTAKSNVVQAVYAGLEQRITRGDFTATDLGHTADSRTAPGSVGALPRGLDTTPLMREGGAV